jgi:hypothetical protein
MPVIQLTSASLTGWPGGNRRDLPPYNRYATVNDGDTSQVRVQPLGAELAAANWIGPNHDPPVLRNPTYQYVDTGHHAVSQANVLWTDSASWCTIVALWSMGHAGLAHVVPGNLAGNDTQNFLNAYNAIPTEIHLATMPVWINKADGFVAVRNTIAAHYGPAYANAAMKVFLISGYAGHNWDQPHQLAVDPRSGAYPVFN